MLRATAVLTLVMATAAPSGCGSLTNLQGIGLDDTIQVYGGVRWDMADVTSHLGTCVKSTLRLLFRALARKEW
jgi:hypothetical protein